MPELPEIETVCRQLRTVILGAEITRTRILDPKLAGVKGLTGRKVEDITRQGKALAMSLTGGRYRYLSFAYDRKISVA